MLRSRFDNAVAIRLSLRSCLATGNSSASLSRRRLGLPRGLCSTGLVRLYYAELGFEVPTYKTVNRGQRDCYPLPNLQPVDCGD